MLEIINYSKSYDGKKKACDTINLSVEKGDIYAFIGHNGAGKTTLLKSIAGILSFEEGDILVDGYSIKKAPLEVKKRIAYIPDNPDIYESLTGIQYLDFIANIFKLDEDRRRQLIREYTNLFEIDHVLNDTIASYSHGMRQKLVIIGALIHEPELWLLDEPFVGLDPKASYLLKKIFKDRVSKGSAIFFSTHVLEVAEKLCNKVAIIKQGKIVTVGDTQKVIQDKSLEKLFMELLEHHEDLS